MEEKEEEEGRRDKVGKEGCKEEKRLGIWEGDK